MVNIRVPIENIDNTVISPAIVSVLNELKKILFIDKETHIEIKNNQTEYINKNWNKGQLDKNDMTGPKDSDIYVEYEVNYDENHIITTPYRKNRAYEILYDKDTQFSIKPLYLESIITLQFTIRDKSKTNLSNTLNNLKLRYIENRSAFYHSILYYYYLPDFIKALVNNFVFNKNYALDTNDTIEEYLHRITTEGFTLLSDLTGNINSLTLAFKEVQNGIIGFFKSDLLNPEKVYDKDTGYWTSTLEYEFRVDQPMFYDITYPTIAYQYELDEALINVARTNNNVHTLHGKTDGYEYYMKKFGVDRLQAYIMSTIREDCSYIRIPFNDVHADVPPRELFTRIFSVQTTITKEDKRNLFNLHDIPDIAIRSEVMAMLEDSEYPYLTESLESPFHIEIYENGKRMDDGTLQVDKFLNVSAVEDLDMTKHYRVFFNVVEQINVLSFPAKERIAKYEEVFSRLKAILDIKKELVNTGSSIIRNLDVDFKLRQQPETAIFFYSYIIGNIMEKRSVNDRL